MTSPEVVEAVPCGELPPRRSRAGRPRQLLDVEAVKAAIAAAPFGCWFRLVAADDRPFSPSEVTALRGALQSGWHRPASRFHDVEIQTRDVAGGLAVYARLQAHHRFATQMAECDCPNPQETP